MSFIGKGVVEVEIVWWIKFWDFGVLSIVVKWMLENYIVWGVNYWGCGVLDFVGRWMLEVWVVGVGVKGSENLDVKKKCKW